MGLGGAVHILNYYGTFQSALQGKNNKFLILGRKFAGSLIDTVWSEVIFQSFDVTGRERPLGSISQELPIPSQTQVRVSCLFITQTSS